MLDARQSDDRIDELDEMADEELPDAPGSAGFEEEHQDTREEEPFPHGYVIA
jgi:hypothetical protein